MGAAWKGTISFGLVSIPVELRGAVQSDHISFRMLHAEDLAPVRYERVCERDGEPVPWKEIVKGYEYAKGKYVILADEDFHAAALASSKTIDILDFVRAHEIDPRFFETPYYVVPAKGGEKGYALLREAMRTTESVGVGKPTMHQKQHLAAIKTVGEASVRVADVGKAEDAATIQTNVVRVDGQRSVYLSILKQGGDTNTIAVVDGVRKAIVNLLNMPKEEKVAGIIPVRAFEEGKFVLMVTRKGTIKKTELSEFANIRPSGINAMGIDDGDELIAIELTDGKKKVFLATHEGMAICFEESGVRSMGRPAYGVRGITLDKGDYVISVAAVPEDIEMLSISENGFCAGKKSV